MRNWVILATSILFTGAIASANEGSDTAKTFDSADADNSGEVSQDEFYGLVSDVGIYSDWDTDGDGFIDDNEYSEIGLDEDFETLDDNNDTYLDSDEFYDGYFTAFDDDEDGYWSSYEWDDAGDAGLFDV